MTGMVAGVDFIGLLLAERLRRGRGAGATARLPSDAARIRPVGSCLLVPVRNAPESKIWMNVSVLCVSHEIRFIRLIELGSVGARLSAAPLLLRLCAC